VKGAPYEAELDALILFEQAQRAFLKSCGWVEDKNGLWKAPQNYPLPRKVGHSFPLGHAINSQIYWLRFYVRTTR
jgi:hypothetical protein